MGKVLSALLILTVGFITTTQAHSAEINNLVKAKNQQMQQDIRFLANLFDIGYAPSEWKNKHLGWDLNQELTSALNKLQAKSETSVKDYQFIVRDFLRSTQDYHVGYSFLATEKATLPFQIKSAEGRYFIVFIDREKLSTTAFPFEVGDEVIQINGKDVKEIIQEINNEFGMGVPETDNALAESLLTRRFASLAMTVPQGSVLFTFKKKSNPKKEYTHQLMWEYKPEKLRYQPPRILSRNNYTYSSDSSIQKRAKPLFKKIKETQMTFGHAQFLTSSEEEKSKPIPNPFRIGAKKSFIPRLGEIIWENDKEALFDAYIYRNKKGRLLGYLRINTYGAGEKNFLELKSIVKKFENLTEGLVIDQINNPGGSVFYLYAIVSILSDKIMHTPQHHIKLDIASILEAHKTLDELKDVKNDEDAQKALGGKTWGGFPVTYQTAQYLNNFSRFIISEWDAGKTLTSPYYIWGADKINPHVEGSYTKPILFLTNELDFSGGDFLPAILQDNKRVTIMGTRTAGAGGYVKQTEYPNNYGLASVSYTGSLAKRVNDQPIENLGVTPDIEYKLSVKDMQNGFSEYAAAIRKEINRLIK